MDHHSDS